LLLLGPYPGFAVTALPGVAVPRLLGPRTSCRCSNTLEVSDPRRLPVDVDLRKLRYFVAVAEELLFF
jgi:hypothetical protein